ncbi:MAG: hypothetical protein SP1CHLAM9_02360 [Chlamydiia bacterium]|nr:hypothetical protein [Chlamydiia bacterium]MCH9624458.1 hypothetical protein [Chlamydiia bacterium]
MKRIIPIYEFSESTKHIKGLDTDTLVIFDVDSVLTIPKTPLFHPKNFSHYKQAISDFYKQISREEKHLVNHHIIAHDVMAVEHEAAAFVKKMQQEKATIIAMTNAKKGLYTDDNTLFSSVRKQQLNSVGIEFSGTFDLVHEFTQLKPTFSDYPAIDHGIIFSCGLDNTKGAVLHEFIKFDRSYKKIILFDDKEKNIVSIEKMLQVEFPECEFFGFHYKGVDLLSSPEKVSEMEILNYLDSLLSKVRNISWIE